MTGSAAEDAIELEEENDDLVVDLDDERVLNVDNFGHNKNGQQELSSDNTASWCSNNSNGSLGKRRWGRQANDANNDQQYNLEL